MDRNTAMFIDGPMLGKTLSPERTPIMLRVAVAPDGTGCCVGRTREPASGETVSVYVLNGQPNTGFWDGRDPKTGRRTGGRMTIARYRLLPTQPEQKVLLTQDAWEAYCEENKPALIAEFERTAKKVGA